MPSTSSVQHWEDSSVESSTDDAVIAHIDYATRSIEFLPFFNVLWVNFAVLLFLVLKPVYFMIHYIMRKTRTVIKLLFTIITEYQHLAVRDLI